MKEELEALFESLIASEEWYKKSNSSDNTINAVIGIKNVNYFIGAEICLDNSEINATVRLYCWTNRIVTPEKKVEIFKNLLNNINDQIDVNGGFFVNQYNYVVLYCEWNPDPSFVLLSGLKRIETLENDIKNLVKKMVSIFYSYYIDFSAVLDDKSQQNIASQLITMKGAGHA